MFAHAVAIAVAEKTGNQYNPLFIYGKVGVGKTHLIHAIGNEIYSKYKLNVKYIFIDKFSNELIDSIKDNKMDIFREKYKKIDEKCKVWSILQVHIKCY